MLSTLGSIASQGGKLPPLTKVYSPFDVDFSNVMSTNSWAKTTLQSMNVVISTTLAKFNKGVYGISSQRGSEGLSLNVGANAIMPTGDFTLQFWLNLNIASNDVMTNICSLGVWVYALQSSNLHDNTRQLLAVISEAYDKEYNEDMGEYYPRDKSRIGLGNAYEILLPTRGLHFYRITRVGSTLRLYIDGVLKGTTSAGTVITKSSPYIGIQIESFTGTGYNSFNIDDFLFTDTVLSGTEVPTAPYL